jgi:hypothetical protein
MSLKDRILEYEKLHGPSKPYIIDLYDLVWKYKFVDNPKIKKLKRILKEYDDKQ